MGSSTAIPDPAVAADEGFFLSIDRAGSIADANSSARIPIGSREELLGRPAGEALGEWPGLRSLVERAIAGESGTSVETVAGCTYCVQCHPRRVDGGAIAGAILIATPTTPLSREVTLLFENVPGAIWTTDRELRLTSVCGRLVNKGELRAHVGMTVEEVVATHEKRDPLLSHHHAALEGKSGTFDLPLRGRWYRVRVEPLPTSDHAIAGTVGAAVDFTELRGLQETLQVRSERLAEAQRLAHVGSWSWDVSTRTITWSDELFRIYGFSPGQFEPTFEWFLSRVHPDDRAETRKRITQAHEQQMQVEFQHRIIRADEAVRMLLTRAGPVVGPDGRTLRLAGSAWDITERWQTNLELEETNATLRATLQATDDGILVVDRAGQIVTFNDQFLALWRVPQRMARDRDDAALIAYVEDQLENPEDFRSRVERLYQSPDAESFDVLQFRDGRVFERYSRPQRIDERVTGRVWSFRDVSERAKLLRRAEFLADASRLLVALEAREALVAVAERAVPAIADLCAFDLFADGHPKRVALAQRPGTRLALEEVPQEIFSGHGRMVEGNADLIAVPIQIRGELLGGLALAVARPRRFGPPDLALAEELASRTALSLDQDHARREAQDALQARDDFLTVAAHEIRLPVTSIHLALHKLRQLDKSKELAPTMDVLERADRRLARLVDELLETGALKGSRFNLQLGEVDLGDVIREVLRALGPELSRSGSTFTLRTEGNLRGKWDRDRLSQVVENLVANAIKFGEGRPIEISAVGNDHHVELTVRDHGIGIPKGLQRKLFEPFGRAVWPHHYGGLGLGLFIVRKIVEALGGGISLQSAAGEGAAFVVQLPLQPSASLEPIEATLSS